MLFKKVIILLKKVPVGSIRLSRLEEAQGGSKFKEGCRRFKKVQVESRKFKKSQKGKRRFQSGPEG